MPLAQLCGLALAYVYFSGIGTLLMRLVLVQVVEAPASRLCFATTFATSMSLFLLVLLHAAANTNSQRPLLAIPQWLLYGSSHDDRSTMPFRSISTSEESGSGSPPPGRYTDAGGVETTVAATFQALLGLLLVQTLVVCPSVLAHLVIAKRLSVKWQRRQQERRGKATAKQLEALNGDPYGRRSRVSRRGRGSFLFCCCPSSPGMRVVCCLLLFLVLGVVFLVFFRTAEVALRFIPVPRHAVTTAAGSLWRISTAVGRRLRVPLEVTARNAGDRSAHHYHDDWQRDPLRHGRVYHWFDVLVANVGTLGVAVVGLLSGYAAVTSPYNYLLSYFYYRKREDVLVQAQQALVKKQRYALTLCGGKVRKLAQESYESRSSLAPGQDDYLYDKVSHHNEQQNRSNGHRTRRGGWLGGILVKTKAAAAAAVSSTKATIGSITGVDVGGGGTRRNTAKERQRLRVDVEHAKNLSVFLYMKMDEVGYMLKEARRGNTWVGRLFALCGLLLSCYSVIKFGLTVASLYLFRASTQDPVTRAISVLEDYCVLPYQTHQQRRLQRGEASPMEASFSLTAIQVSAQVVIGLAVLVNAWMIASSIRGLLLTIFQATLSFTTLVTADTTAVMFAFLMAVYFVGQLILLRQSLPSPSMSRTAPSLHDSVGNSPNVLHVVLGSLPLYFYQRVNDWWFVIGCVVTVVARRWLLADPSNTTVAFAHA